MNFPACWVCGQVKRRPVNLKAWGAVYVCPGCGLSHRWPLPDADRIAEDLRRPRDLSPQLLDQQRKGKHALRLWELSLVEELTPRGRLLDVGCGYGLFLEEARRRGWEVAGIELSYPENHYANDVFHLNVRDTPLEAARLPENSFDVVTLWEVVELLAEPWRVIREAFRILKPGGWLWLRSNNARFHLPALRWAQRAPLRWTGMQPGVFHVYGPTSSSLERGLKRGGFVNEASFPSRTTEGDPYKLGGRLGAAAVVAGKKCWEAAAGALFHATGGRALFSSTFITRAQKPDPRPLVLHVITRLDKGGSAENVALSVEKVSSEKMRHMAVSGPSSTPIDPLPKNLLTCLALRRALHPWQDWRAFLALRRLMSALRPALVHTHSSKAGFLGRWAAWSAGVPFLVHTPHGHVFYGYFNVLKSWFYAVLERFTAPITARLIALTEGERRESLAWGMGKPAQWQVIPSGVDLDSSWSRQKSRWRRELRSQWNLPEDVLVVGFLGRFEPVKGLRVLLEALEKLWSQGSGLCFLGVGDGPQRLELERFSRKFPGRVITPGFQNAPQKYLSAMDIFVQPSLNEGQGKTLVLAQALGLPVVASRVCGIPSVVKENDTALLVPAGDAHALALALDRLAVRPDLRRQMAAAGPAWINQRLEGGAQFSVQRMVYLLNNLYSQLITPFFHRREEGPVRQGQASGTGAARPGFRQKPRRGG